MFGSVRRKLEQTQAALTAALAERDAYLTQRDIALGERNEFQRQLELLRITHAQHLTFKAASPPPFSVTRRLGMPRCSRAAAICTDCS